MFISRVRVKQNIRELSHLSSLLRHNGYGCHQLLFDLFPASKERSFLFREEIAKEQLGNHLKVKGEPVYYLVSSIEPSDQSPLFSVETKAYHPRIEHGDRLAFKVRANPTVAKKSAKRDQSVRHDVVMDAQRMLLQELANVLGETTEGTKSELRNRVFTSWVKTCNGKATAFLEQVINENERYAHLLGRDIQREELMDTAVKAVSDKRLESWLTDRGKRNGFDLVCSGSHRDLPGRLKFQAESYRWHPLSKKGKAAGFSSIDFEGELEVTDPKLFLDSLYHGIGPAKSFGCGLMLVRRVSV